jgi:CHAT domain-containing protein
LATLSACETGLGETAGGEGLLGLQRAFQIAGTQTVITSLWKVSDSATQAMMDRFYRRLWAAKDPMGRLAALHEAQLWVLEGARLTDDGKTRGLDLDGGHAADRDGRLPPYYWAAFVLSGDWR